MFCVLSLCVFFPPFIKYKRAFVESLPVFFLHRKWWSYAAERKRRERERDRDRQTDGVEAGGVSAVSGHMTRKMWDLIPVLDCSQLLKLCPSQCKPSVCLTATPGPRSDRPQRAMAGKQRAGTSADIRGGLTPTGTRPLRNQDRCCAKTAISSLNTAKFVLTLQNTPGATRAAALLWTDEAKGVQCSEICQDVF